MADAKEHELKTTAHPQASEVNGQTTEIPQKHATEGFNEKPARHSYIDDEGLEHFTAPPTTAADLTTEVIHASDDPTLNPWTFRTWFLGGYKPSL